VDFAQSILCLQWEPSSIFWRFPAMPALAPGKGVDWTNEERQQIGRLQDVCARNKHFSLECNRTDAGDPWCVICNDRDGTVICHLARLNRRYVVAVPAQRISFWSATISGAVDHILTMFGGAN
jgi:hypothetical protein